MLFQLINGNAGLLVTDMPKEEVERYLSIPCSLSFSLLCFDETNSDGLELYPCLFAVTAHAPSGCIADYLMLMRIPTFQGPEALQQKRFVNRTCAISIYCCF